MERSSNLPVREFMVKNIVSINSSDTIKKAIKQMYENRVGAAVVLDKENLVGIVTDRDVAMAIGVFGKSLDLPASTIMSSPVFHVTPEESILKTAEIMASKNIRRMPVVEQGKVLGMISTTDLMVLFSMCKEEELKKIFGPFLNT